MFGKHLLKGWSSTQKVIALSSGEAEYYGIVRGSSEAIGSRNLLADMNVEVRIRVHEDSSAAKSVAQRIGAEKLRHIEVNQLWVQEKVRDKVIEISKVKGVDNLADPLTKYVDAHDICKHLRGIYCSIGIGRHDIMPEVGDDIDIESLGEVQDFEEEEAGNSVLKKCDIEEIGSICMLGDVYRYACIP